MFTTNQSSLVDRLRQALAHPSIPYARRTRLIPYFTAGFPDSITVEKLIRSADKLGVSAIELGLPYSDSIADGPVIQSSFHHALEHGFRVNHAFEMLSRLRDTVSCPMIAMLSYSIVHRLGLSTFMHRAADTGFSGVILPDVPGEESSSTSESAAQAGLSYVGMIAPRTSKQRCIEIARHSSGFLYLIAASGTTGERKSLDAGLQNQVAALRNISDLPICVGFGISSADQVRNICQFADAAIVGSALIKRIADAVAQQFSPDRIVGLSEEFLSELLHDSEPRP